MQFTTTCCDIARQKALFNELNSLRNKCKMTFNDEKV